MSCAVVTRTIAGPAGGSTVPGPTTSVGRDREAHLAARPVPDEPDRVDGLPRGSRGDDDPDAREVPAARESLLDGPDDVLRLAHAADPFVAGGEGTALGADDPGAALEERRDVRLRRRVPPHPSVHRGGEHERGVGFEQRRGQEVVGDAGGELGDDVGRRRRHHHHVGLVRELDVQDLAGLLPQVRVHAVVRQRREGGRADEPLGRPTHHHPDGGAAEPEEPGQDAGLVRGDAPGDAEQDALAAQDGRTAALHVPTSRAEPGGAPAGSAT
jgi:hypothetical protein